MNEREQIRKYEIFGIEINKAGYTATLVACVWAGAVLEKVIRASGQEPYAQKAQKRRKSNKSSKDRRWSAVPDALLGVKKWSESRAAAPKGRCPVGHRGEFPHLSPSIHLFLGRQP